MACPYLGSISDDPNNVADHTQLVTITQDEHIEHVSSTEQQVPLNYTTYLRTPLLLGALKCLSHIDLSDEQSPPVHDEHFFILIHQGKYQFGYIHIIIRYIYF
jgi:hypothetical protein